MLTVSDRASAGSMTDESGPAVAAILRREGFEVGAAEIVPDDRDRIVAWMRERSGRHDLLVTTGGTGLAVRDVTPEATGEVIERDVPGLAELMRQVGIRSTPLAALSRARAGIHGHSLIVNLPGSLRGATESLEAIAPVLVHATRLLRGVTEHR